MRALVFRSFGGPEVLALEELPEPTLEPGHALVRTRAIGLNFADVYRRRGDYHLQGEAPWILGYEGAGVVERLHPDDPETGGLAVGRRVGFADVPFANAELVSAPIERLIALPDEISSDVAAASLLQGLTADYLIHDAHAVAPRERVVIHAAAGGVGLLLTAMARQRGAEVIAIASTEEKRAAACEAGAAHAIGYDGWVDRVRALGGADVVYDSVGSTLGESFAAARTGGHVVFYGMAGGNPAPVDPRMLMDRSLSLTGGDLWNVLVSHEERERRAGRLFDAIARGRLPLRIARRFPLAEGAEAHRFLESRGAIGKVLLVP